METIAVHPGYLIAQPLPDNNGYTWTLPSRLGQMIREAEREYGERDKSYTILGVEFVESGPQIWYPGSGESVVIQLGLPSLSEPSRAFYQLAHETIHLLSPSGGRNANCLEEGIATSFASVYMRRHFSVDWRPGLDSYKRAASAVESFLAGRPGIIKTLRRSEPVISKITSDMIISACPDFDPEMAEYLCSAFIRN